ncbi:MAG: acyl dehydratase [Betaproteobacteria bacterium]|nr:acyl dehydratase [Betaproteobacteria bacterium]
MNQSIEAREPVHTGRVTDAELARVRSLIGKRVEIKEPPYLTEVTRDAVRHWVWAIGDRNRLYLEDDYAKASPYKGIIAPPSMLYAFSRMSIGYRGGLPGVHSMFGGSHWRWKEPGKLGDTIRPEVTFKDLIELPSRFAGRMFKQISSIDFRTSDGRLLAQSESWGMRMERTQAKDKGKYKALEKKPYSKEEIQAIADRMLNETPRGADFLYFEDVEMGAPVTEIVRGPYTATVAVAFEQAWGGLFVWAHSYWYDYLRRHPAAGVLNGYGIPEPPEAVHWDTVLAKSVGVPEAYDYGPERISWLSVMLTNWIGDHGFLEELYCEIRRFNLIGDTTYCRGRVIEKEALPDGRGRIKIAIEAVDQRDQVTAKGWASVLLPGRGR